LFLFLRKFYEDYCFFLDVSLCESLIPLISELKQVLFAINIDNPVFDIISNKQQQINEIDTSGDNKQSKISPLPVIINNNDNNDIIPPSTTATTTKKIKQKRKNNVVVMDDDDNNSNNINSSTFYNKPLLSQSVKSSQLIINNGSIREEVYNNNSPPIEDDSPSTINNNKNDEQRSSTEYNNNNNDDDDDCFNDNDSLSSKTTTKSLKERSPASPNSSFTILTNPIKYNRLSSSLSASSLTSHQQATFDQNQNISGSLNDRVARINSLARKIQNKIKRNGSELSIESSGTNFDTDDIYSMTTNDNLIPINNNRDDTTQTGSLNSELSNDLSTTATRRESVRPPINHESLSIDELRQLVLTMIQRKDQLTESNQKLTETVNIEQERCRLIYDKLEAQQKDAKLQQEFNETKLKNLENENKLLKDQLKKYVSAVQMIRSNNNNNSNNQSSSKQINETLSSVDTFIMPAVNTTLQRDYSYEADQYEAKLIQVAEMHGELMEFNSRLHRILNFRTMQVDKLREELTQLRGPLPSEYNQSDASIIESDPESLNQIGSPLINIWIPSAFLRSDKTGSHHVYQIYIRIKDEEWNIYRRFSHFFNLNEKLKQKYPFITGVKFPKKRTLGNKDVKFVEERRKMLQQYLRETINKITQLDKDLNMKPCRQTISKAIPFLRYF
jgi:hypothetical protein